MDVIEIAIKHHTSDLTTKAMAMVALLKLSSRFPSCSEYVMFFYLFCCLSHFFSQMMPTFVKCINLSILLSVVMTQSMIVL